MQTSLTGPDGRTLSVTCELIPVHYLSDIDAHWRFTDAAGHVHHCDYDAANHWPTLRRVADGTWWCEDCRDEHEDTHLKCQRCGERIAPGVTGPGTKYVQGPTTYLLDGQPVTRKQALAFAEQQRR